MRHENEIFADYQEKKTPELEEELAKALRAHGCAVVWELLHETNMDIVNWGIFMALKNADKFRGEALFSTWFHQIIKNMCLNTIKGRTRRREVQLDTDVSYVPVEPSAFLLSHLTRGLKPMERQLLELKVSGANFKEIARQLGITVKYAKNKWTRLRHKLEEKRQ